jgi:hypothetical protein
MRRHLGAEMQISGTPVLPSDILARVDGIFSAIARRHFGLSVVALLVFITAYNGLGVVPHEPYRLTAQNPFERVQAHRENYFQESPLLPLVAYYSRLTSGFSFNALCLAIIILGYVSYAVQARKRLGSVGALLLLCLLAAHPVTLVLLSWIGAPDCITFLLTVFLLFSRSPVAIGAISLLGSFNHPIMLLVAPVVLLLRRLSREDEIGYLHFAASGVGLVLGSLAVRGFLDINHIDTYSRLDFLMSRSLMSWIRHDLSNLPMALFSLHNLVWFAWVACAVLFFRRNRAYFGVLLVAQVVMYGVTFFSVDTTRVFTLLAWAPAFHCLQYSLRLGGESDGMALSTQLRGVLLIVALVGIVKPNYYVWDGTIYGPSFNDFYFPVLERLRGLLH